MAPGLDPRQFYHLPPPRPSKGAPGRTPVHVTKYASVKVFGQLLAGTVCIFILAVLFWKVGKFMRFLSRDRVVKAGRNPNTRYARTWYGWVSWERHEAHKDFFRRGFRKYQQWTDWRSSSTDYGWIWWDPGQKEFEKHRERRWPLRWLPKWLRSYKVIPADKIWNPGPPAGFNIGEKNSQSADFFQMPAKAKCCGRNDDPSRRAKMMASSPIVRKPARTRISSMTLAGGEAFGSYHDVAFENNSLLEKGRLFWSLNSARRPRGRGRLPIHFPATESMAQWSASLPNLAHPAARPGTSQKNPILLSDPIPESEVSTDVDNSSLSSVPPSVRRYQVWSTRMQIQASGMIQRKQCGLLGRPGSPRTELLRSSLFEPRLVSQPPLRSQEQRVILSPKSGNRSSSILETNYITARSHLASSQDHDLEVKWNSTTFPGEPILSFSATEATPIGREPSSARYGRPPRISTQLAESSASPRSRGVDKKRRSKPMKAVAARKRKWRPIPMQRLSDCEILLMDKVDRKLDWLLSELEPGRKPFHFAPLANHWLNRETWIVLDPVSRVPSEHRRLWGDPKHHVPYPTATYGAKPKYPWTSRKRADSPRIDSWRKAVNRNRRVSGVRHGLKSLELYDNSADEPPDGKIDPSCWILRKPPQGFAMSTKQQDAYYEGGHGWHEKLPDWQRVRRGYRISKVIHEGRVNRNRVKELARGFSRYYRANPVGD